MCLTRQHQSKMYLHVSKCIQMYLSVLFHVLSQLDPHLMLLRWTSQLRSPTTRRSSLSKWWGLDPRSRWFTRRKSKDNWTLPNFYLVWWLQTFHRKTINFSIFFSPKVQFWGIGCEDASRHLFLHRQWQDLEGQGQVMALDCGWMRLLCLWQDRSFETNSCLIDWYIHIYIYI